jgi:hypothetical protein
MQKPLSAVVVLDLTRSGLAARQRSDLMDRTWLSIVGKLAFIFLWGVLSLGISAPLHAEAPKPAEVFLTWMSVTNWLFEVGNSRIVMDGYISRIPQEAFSGPSFATARPTKPDEPAIRQVIAALGGSGKIDFILTGHSHFDHSFDTARRSWRVLLQFAVGGALGARPSWSLCKAGGTPALPGKDSFGPPTRQRGVWVARNRSTAVLAAA